MYKILPICMILSLGCSSSKEKTPEPSHQKNDVDVLQQLQRRATMAQLNLQAAGVIKRDEDPVEDTIYSSTPENLQERLSALANNLEAQLELYRETKRAAKAAPSIQKTVKAGKREFIFESTLLDVKKVSCKGLGSDLLCNLTFIVLRSNEGIRFEMKDADGAQLNYPTVGIPKRTKNGVLTTQEIIIPKGTSTLTFLER